MKDWFSIIFNGIVKCIWEPRKYHTVLTAKNKSPGASKDFLCKCLQKAFNQKETSTALNRGNKSQQIELTQYKYRPGKFSDLNISQYKFHENWPTQLIINITNYINTNNMFVDIEQKMLFSISCSILIISHATLFSSDGEKGQAMIKTF